MRDDGDMPDALVIRHVAFEILFAMLRSGIPS